MYSQYVAACFMPTKWLFHKDPFLKVNKMFEKIFRSFLIYALINVFFVLVANAETVVKWDSLKNLDNLAERCEALSDSKDISGLRKLIKPVRSAMASVAADPVPKDAKLPDQVKFLQADLKNLSEVLSDPQIEANTEFVEILAGIHPIVENLMEAAGMPHVHENDEQVNKATQENRP